MSLVWFTDGVTGKQVAINPTYVVAVFTATEGEAKGLTIISLVSGTIPVRDEQLDVVTALNTNGVSV